MAIIAPSILSADFTILGKEISAVEKAGADWIHIDVMDGSFVPNISYGPIIVDACKKVTTLPLDVHLMIEHPDHLIPDFVKAGADLISVHAEACTHLHRTVQLIQESKVKAGVAVNPATPLTCLEWIIEELDFVLLMSVNPGFGGQKFIQSTLDKIEQLAALIEETGSRAIIQVDGGVGPTTINGVAKAGATSFVAGSAIFSTPDYAQTITMLRQQAEVSAGA
ncbi:Rpe [Desulforapulum autotrophicum HRM2]|uniref:Ribulose-phosphate 3-epimerase n=1 Tax=Desulforapulum autotrophicum (strain ATCC 43914 / DSM 3382 / VKM B-1955 / HRM2) TaxID=177437 RepID=C0QI58_DESAH|nr:ribulose-phosphate 3-epimerase [Desulforapulum autotrophicum]ACN15794.1 Rpe [Desulforapulum autotrophicum HRM2]